MALRNALLVSLSAVATLAQGPADYIDQPSSEPRDYPYLNNQTIAYPPEGDQLSYPRYVELLDGTILVTTDGGATGPDGLPAFPVFASTDGGASWDQISNITDQVNGWGLGAQPALMELTESLGGYDEGTILASGNSWSGNGTRIDLYASKDKAQTWEFVSHIAEGGPPNTTNGATPIWEPYLMLYNHELVAFYSDQRDPAHGQKLAHQCSKDLRHWGPVVNDVAYPTYADRPGMTVITELPNGKWMFVHEYPGGYSLGLARYPVFYHIANSPVTFYEDDPHGTPLIAQGFQPSSSPFVVWSPQGGDNGTIVVSDADHTGVFVNTMLGDPTGWRYKLTGARDAYSRALAIWNGQPNKLAIISGAAYGDSQNNITNPLTLNVLNLEELIWQNPPPDPVTPLSIYYPDLGNTGNQ